MPVRSARTARCTQLVALIVALVAALSLFLTVALPAGSARAQAAPTPALPTPDPAAGATAYMVELADPPAATVLARTPGGLTAASAAAVTKAQVAQVAAAQAAVSVQLAALNTPVLYATQRVYNGIAVLADAEQATAIAALPGVVAVHPLIPKRPDNATSVPFLGVPALWQGAGLLGPSLPGLRGEGIRIGIIDTGIDYLHVDFGGPGVGYAANDTTRIGDVAGFPGVKVAGGYDFAGDAYNADAAATAAQLTPRPDPDPLDCYGHGTHVAGTVAGYGVIGGGTTYPGPYTDGLDFSTFSIGPGVAPAAQIYALKIFGCTGSSNLTEAALEWAVDPNRDGDFADHLDVVNLSLGSPYGAPYDTSAVAADNAAAAGVIVVASAGNSGNTNLIVGTPSVADRAISVAASQHHLGTGAAGLGSDTGADFSARGPRRGDGALKPDVAAPGVGIVSASALSGSGRYTASGTSMAAPHVAGFMALLRQLHPDWSVEELKALAMNTAMPFVRTGEDLAATPFTPLRTGAGRIEPRAAVRAEVVAYAAPGTGRVGLSFGAPEVADSYADLRPVRVDNKSVQPVTYTVAYNSLVNTPGVTVQPPLGPVSIGPGGSAQFAVGLQIDGTALRRVLSAVDQASIASGAWLPEESGHLFLWPVEPPVHLALGGGVDATLRYDAPSRTLGYTLTLTGLDAAQITGATIALNQSGGDNGPITLLPLGGTVGSSLTGTVVLDARAERWLAAGWLRLEVRSPALADGMVSGPIAFAQPVLHLPVFAGPRPVAAMRATQPSLTLDAGGVQVLALGGRTLTGSAPPTDVVALAAVTQLQLRSPNGRPIGLPAGAPDAYDQADIKYVGIAGDFGGTAAGRVEDTTLYFAVATWAPWTTPNEVQFNVRIDVDGDGKTDYRLYNLDRASFNGNKRGDAFVSVLENAKTGKRAVQAPVNGVEPSVYDTSPYFADVLLLPVKASALGLTGARSKFTYYVDTTSIDVSEDSVTRVDVTPRLAYDVAQPLLTATGPLVAGPLLADQPGTAVPVRLNLLGFATQPNPALLVLHLHNRAGDKADVVEVGYTWPFTLRLPWVARR